VTLADVAASAGVSQATASRALRGHGRISGPTRQLVQEVAARLRYVPNAAARSLAIRRTRTLGLILVDFADPFHAQVATGFEAVAAAAGYTAIIVPGAGKRRGEERAMNVLIEYGAEGIAQAASVLDPMDVRREASLEALVSIQPDHRGILSRQYRPPPGTIQFDDVSAVTDAIHYLLGLGYREVAYVGAGNGPSQVLRRRTATRVLREAGAAPLRALTVDRDAWRTPGAVGSVISRPLPQAILCYDDTLALALLHDLQAAGVSVPGDIAVVGFDGIPYAALSTPALTTLAAPMVEMGRMAASTLVQAISTGRLPPPVLLPATLIVRDSTQGDPRIVPNA
jgi:LacI family transcriptional regulator